MHKSEIRFLRRVALAMIEGAEAGIERGMRVEFIDALFSTRQFAASRSTVCKDYAEDNIEGQIFAGHQQRSREVSTSLTRRITHPSCASARL